MLLKRSSTSKFFAKAFVFPGGATEAADFSPNWLKHFTESGFDREQLASEFIVSLHHRIPLYANASTFPDCIPEISFRISAIRETFEETGVLFCKPIESDRNNASEFFTIDDLQEWQERVHGNPEQFLHLCQQYKLYPDIWSLYEWSNWLTPANMGPKRYDTIFYLAVVDNQPKVRIDGTEITQIQVGYFSISLLYRPLKNLPSHTVIYYRSGSTRSVPFGRMYKVIFGWLLLRCTNCADLRILILLKN